MGACKLKRGLAYRDRFEPYDVLDIGFDLIVRVAGLRARDRRRVWREMTVRDRIVSRPGDMHVLRRQR